jgi:hypothetical protein
VKNLESRLMPTDEPMVIHIVYVSPDGTRTDGPRIKCGALRTRLSAADVPSNPVPVVSASVALSSLAQNNHELVNVGLAAMASDGACPAPTTFSVQVFGNEDDQTPTDQNEVYSPDAKDIGIGTLRLRAEGVSSGDGADIPHRRQSH